MERKWNQSKFQISNLTTSFFIHVILNFILNFLFCTLYYEFFCLSNPNWIKTTIIYRQANKIRPYWLLLQKSNQLSIYQSRKIKSASALTLIIKYCCEWKDIKQYYIMTLLRNELFSIYLDVIASYTRLVSRDVLKSFS